MKDLLLRHGCAAAAFLRETNMNHEYEK